MQPEEYLIFNATEKHSYSQVRTRTMFTTLLHHPSTATPPPTLKTLIVKDLKVMFWLNLSQCTIFCIRLGK